MCQELEMKDPKTPANNLFDHQFMICKYLLTSLAEPRELQRQQQGESYVTIRNVGLAVCGMLEVLFSAQTDITLREVVRAVAVAVEMDMLVRWYPEEDISSARSKKKTGKHLRLARIAAALDPRTKDFSQATKRERKDMHFFPIREEFIQKAKDKPNNDAMLEDPRMRQGNNNLSDNEDEGEATPDKSALSRMLARAKQGRALDLDTTSSDDDGPTDSDGDSWPEDDGAD